MESLMILIPLALVMVAVALWLFFWATDNGQFDDLEGPAHSILFEDEQPRQQSSPDQITIAKEKTAHDH